MECNSGAAVVLCLPDGTAGNDGSKCVATHDALVECMLRAPKDGGVGEKGGDGVDGPAGAATCVDTMAAGYVGAPITCNPTTGMPSTDRCGKELADLTVCLGTQP